MINHSPWLYFFFTFTHLADAFIQSDLQCFQATWAKEKKNWTVAQWSKVLFSEESNFCISFGNQGSRVWRKGGEAPSPSCLKSSVKFTQSVMIWGAMSSRWCWSIVFFFITETSLHPFTKIFWINSCFLLLTSFLKMLISFSRQDWHLHTLPKAPKLVKWPWCWCAWLASKRTRPEPHRESPKNADELKATVKETWASIPPQQCHKLITATPNWGSN